MKRYSVIIPFFAGTLIYSILAFYVGPKGYIPMQQLYEQKLRIANNLENLNTSKNELTNRFNNLKADTDTIAVYAHELGFVAEGEQLIKLAGFSGGIDRSMNAGMALSVQKPLYLPEWICKLAGILSGTLCFLLGPYRPGDKKRFSGGLHLPGFVQRKLNFRSFSFKKQFQK